MKSMSRPALVVAVLALSLGALGIGYWWGQSRVDAPATTTPAARADAGDRKILYWYDPMLPQEKYPGPGKSSMNMDLIPKYAGESGAAAGGMTIAPALRQNLGLRTVVVKTGSVAGVLRVPGTISWDLRQERVVSARVDSIVERLYVRAPFEPVRAGQALASVIAPAWSTALAEANALGNAQSASARALQSAARERLHALGLPAGGTGRRGAVTLRAPLDGVVSEIGVREGQAVPTGTLLFRVNGIRTVWLEAAIPQGGSAGVQAGTPVTATVDAVPGRTFAGRVETLLPQVDAGSRTQRARVVLDNHDGALASGMFAQITLEPTGGAEHPLVPSDAVISPGDRPRVIVLGDDGTFRPVAVETGRSSGGMTEILSGLKGGERVVASGQFLIDSEASLSGALERMGVDAPDADVTTPAETSPSAHEAEGARADQPAARAVQHQHQAGHATPEPRP
jgi:membrane fusion protein, copper/silver efflux system